MSPIASTIAAISRYLEALESNDLETANTLMMTSTDTTTMSRVRSASTVPRLHEKLPFDSLEKE